MRVGLRSMGVLAVVLGLLAGVSPVGAWNRFDALPSSVFHRDTPDACPEVFFLGAMGSGQFRDKVAHPMGKQVEELERRFSREIAKRNAPGSTRAIATAPVGIDYRAVDANRAAVPGRAVYNASVNEGKRVILDELNALSVRCGPDARFVLAGFSQGAQAVHYALKGVPVALRDRISAVMLLADARFNSGQPGVSYLGQNVGAGILGSYPIPGWAASRTIHICAAADGICQGASGIVVPWPDHYNYLKHAGTWLTPPAKWAANKTVVPDAMPTCNGLEATHVGSSANDTIIGTPNSDVIAGEGGNDHLEGRGGDDTICGGAGIDTIWGGKGDNTCIGYGGPDTLKNCRPPDTNPPEPPHHWNWVHQLGTTTWDLATGVAVDGIGNVYITGGTYGALPGSPEPNAGNVDAFVAKYNTSGAIQWVHQLGSTTGDVGYGVSVDGSGNVYITGGTDGALPGSPEPSVGNRDTFVAKYNTSGAIQWVHQLGTTGDDASHGVAADGSGNVYITGGTYGALPGSPEPNAGNVDAFVAKYNASGAIQWVHQLGTTGDDGSSGVAVDGSSNVYITGYTDGTLPGSSEASVSRSEAFVAKYNSAGVKQWVHQLGDGLNYGGTGGVSVAVDAVGNVYVAGGASDALPGAPEPPAGIGDAFIAKYTSAGLKQWVHLLGGTGQEGLGHGVGLAVDGDGNAYIAGGTSGSLPGAPEPNTHEHYDDIFVARYSSSGLIQWVHQLGTAGVDGATGVAVDGSGSVYIAGQAGGTLPGAPEPNAGDFDAFVARY